MADLKKIKLDDGVEYEAEAAVIAEMNKQKQRADGLDKDIVVLNTEKSKIEAERDAYKEKLDAAEKKLDEAKDRVDAAQVEALVQKRLAILADAQKAKVEVKADMDENAIVVAVIQSVFPDAKLDGKDAAYIAARYDCAKEELAKRDTADADASIRQAAGETHADTAPDARAEMLKAREEQWKMKK